MRVLWGIQRCDQALIMPGEIDESVGATMHHVVCTSVGNVLLEFSACRGSQENGVPVAPTDRWSCNLVIIGSEAIAELTDQSCIGKGSIHGPE